VGALHDENGLMLFAIFTTLRAFLIWLIRAGISEGDSFWLKDVLVHSLLLLFKKKTLEKNG
jgi:hypothetical protein